MIGKTTLASLFAMSFCTPSHAIDDLTTRAILDSITQRQKVMVANNLRSITAYYLGEHGGCSNVSVEQSNRRRGRDHFRVCDGRVEEVQTVAPSVPNEDPNYRHVVVMVGRQALLMGVATGRFDGYLVEAKRVGWPANNGCGTVDITVSHEGALVDNAQPRVCP
ncbi:MAG: hypothetical protein Q8M09_08255 [Pseudomonadota bacterium]|nr:hypothetical protein [Pseudomonadota bacterium]MDP1904221.1 hypothetical protein [Pseudomonadota bacterium]